MRSTERGFTLIELLTVTFLIGVLYYLSMQSYTLYRHNAAYASVENTLHAAVVAAEASQTDANNLPPAVGWYFQRSQGELTDAAAAEYLAGLRLPRKTCLWTHYQPACSGAACLSDFVMVAHCMGNQFAEWLRFGDGWSITLRNIPGTFPGCC